MTSLGETVHLSTQLLVGPDRVFECLTAQSLVKAWMIGDQAETSSFFDIDLRIGGHLRLSAWSGSGRLMNVNGVYQIINRPFRLEHTWLWEEDWLGIGETKVIYKLTDLNYQTQLEVTQQFFYKPEALDFHNALWAKCLERLALVVTDNGRKL